MDERLSLVNGRQVAPLTRDDLPILARAIVAAVRRRGAVGREIVRGVTVIHLLGVGYDLYVRADDWLKIAPYFVDGTFNPEVAAVADQISDTDSSYDVSTIDLRDRDFYQRVLGILSVLFPDPYPTSNL